MVRLVVGDWSTWKIVSCLRYDRIIRRGPPHHRCQRTREFWHLGKFGHAGQSFRFILVGRVILHETGGSLILLAALFVHRDLVTKLVLGVLMVWTIGRNNSIIFFLFFSHSFSYHCFFFLLFYALFHFFFVRHLYYRFFSDGWTVRLCVGQQLLLTVNRPTRARLTLPGWTASWKWRHALHCLTPRSCESHAVCSWALGRRTLASDTSYRSNCRRTTRLTTPNTPFSQLFFQRMPPKEYPVTIFQSSIFSYCKSLTLER